MIKLNTISIFHTDHTTNMDAIGSSCLWLANSKIFSKTIWPN